MMMTCATTLLTVALANGPTTVAQPVMDRVVVDPAMRESMVPRHAMLPSLMTFPAKEIDASYDVQEYTVDVDWRSALLTPRAQRGDVKFTGRVRMALTRRSADVDQLLVDACEMEITRVSVDGIDVTDGTQYGGCTLSVPVPGAAERPLDVVVEIDYGARTDDQGFYAYADSDLMELGPERAIAMTFCQPEQARYWMPCHDVPWDKAMMTASATVPAGFVTVSNGVRIDSLSLTDGIRETWRHEQPMSTYLLTMNASRYVVYHQEYVRDDMTIPIANYQWASDVDGDRYNVQAATARVPEMFAVLEGAFGPYPFRTYGHVAITPFAYGGMEHQSMSTVNRDWLRGVAEFGYAHEIAHQWFGDWVTCATWADIWLNEGAASWSEALWSQERGSGVQGYRDVMQNRRRRYLERGLSEPPVYDIPIATLFNDGTTYAKSAWIYHMIRTNAGEEAFWPALRGYLQTYALQALQTADALAYWRTAVPEPLVDWDTFFDQWLYKAGHPQLVVDVNFSESTAPIVDARISLTQIQTRNRVPEAFVIPVRVQTFVNDLVTKDTVILMRDRSAIASVALPSMPDSIRINGDDEVLMEVVRTTTSVDDDDRLARLRIVGRHPVRRGDDIVIGNVEQPTPWALVDVTGRTVAAGRTDGPTLTVSGAGIPAGVYHVVFPGRPTRPLPLMVVEQ